jgi:hypothetical protein
MSLQLTEESSGMATYDAVMNEHARGTSWGEGPWLRSPSWDLCFLTLSGVLVVIPLILFEIMGRSAMFINLFVAGVIGGPHMYATFFRTALDPAFRRHHPVVMVASAMIPILVIACAVWHFQLLITLFFFWASIHVLHQITYILECYDRKQPSGLLRWSKLIDYAVVFSCLFPLATYKFIHGSFYIGNTQLLYPEALKIPLVFYAVTAFFVLALLLFVVKTVIEIRHGEVHYPKLVLILTTVTLALIITSYSGSQLEIAFQGFNTWHSFQYMALTWYILMLQQPHMLQSSGEPRANTSNIMSWLHDTVERRRFWHFYAPNLMLTALALVVIWAVVSLTGIAFEHSYYIVVLSVLLIHYFHDHVLFTKFAYLRRG